MNREALAAGLAAGVALLAFELYRRQVAALAADQPQELQWSDQWDAYVPAEELPPVDAGAIVADFEGEGYAALDMLLPVAYRVENVFLSAWGSRMHLSLAGLDAIKRHEAFSPVPYRDQAGHWTIGYGHKLGPLEQYASIGDGKAVELLARDVGIAEDAVNSAVQVPIAQPMFDALVSFAFNVGVGAFRSSTLLKLLNRGDYGGAQQQFTRWRYITKGGQKVESAGLLNRRNAEAALFASAGLAGGSA